VSRTEITLVVIATVADVPVLPGQAAVARAAGVPGGPRYRMHDLVRLYARERADAEEPPAQRAAVDRLIGSYLAITHEPTSHSGPTSRATLLRGQLGGLYWR
jgi:hypothetical protein